MFYLYKRRIFLPKIASRPVVKSLAFTAILATTLLSSCFLKQDRTTTVYGTITDQNGEPVDSIMVLAQGMHYLIFESLQHTYSDSNGHFEMVIEVPKRFGTIDISVPFYPKENPKFQKYYKGKKTIKNDMATSNCCITSVGKKTKYDFQLIPK
ncbi:hypothetical protein [Dyadobacter fanqingshengii]|uniref:Carboxypeptidase regulatory-like domain-containing protein n=1 Tax=Dyadobacter fanqingshengii TaxID=2906443 RepID=A0A9X1P4Z1_9BACT|nr:hypothetical protein [Dyadobacter fanqingshengii]MCF0038516.1 hypothetical protein [Dyadobacter fanqingshengii]USJ34651.1 hypothetical protein NFI81_18275 [Dyadobacter fanqingshengii]